MSSSPRPAPARASSGPAPSLRTRTPSLLASFKGRFSFGRGESRDENDSAAHGSGNLRESRSDVGRTGAGAALDRYLANKPPKSQSAIFNRRLSTPAPNHLRSPPPPRSKSSSLLAKHIGSFSRSSPDLTSEAELYQPWPSPSRATIDDICNASARRGSLPEEEHDSDQFNELGSPPPPSPPLPDAARQLSRAAALAKLESSGPIPFPTSSHPPRPTRALPQPPSPFSDDRRRSTDSGNERGQLAELEGIRSHLKPLRPRRNSSHPAATSTSRSALSSKPLSPSPSLHSRPILHISTPSTPNRERASSGSTASPLPSEINLRGRVVRARNLTPSHDSSAGSTEHAMDWSSPSEAGSSLTDCSSRERRSLDYAGPSVSFIDRVREREYGVSGGMGKVYGDKRMAESAIEIMTVVEEDESPSGMLRRARGLSRHSQPGRLCTSPSPQSSVGSNPSKLPESYTSSLVLDSVSPLPGPRGRTSSGLKRSHLGRSLSTSAAFPNLTEREEQGPIALRIDFAHPSGSPDRTLVPSSSPSSLSVTRPDNHKRWSSEIGPVGVPRESEDCLVFRPKRNSRTSSSGRDDDEGGLGSGVRTKLVLREHGQPTTTYQLGECIGRGQFGAVYRALNLTSGCVVAVKRIRIQGKTESEVEQLESEVDVLKSLAHPGVVKYAGVVRDEHYINIILEYVENGSLQKTLKHFGELPEQLIASYVVKILEGLDYLHSKRVVHCDLKCANILSTKNGNIKLSDFGVSLNLNAAQHLNTDVSGTPNWMAPEVIQLLGASTASDIWSLACTIVELVTGKPPYSELLPMSAMFNIVMDRCPPIPPRCSPELADFLTQCFAKDPLERPTARDLFGHVWLQRNWDPQKDLRPQDSIPFLRRISSDTRRDANARQIHSRMSPTNEIFDVSASPVSRMAPPFPEPTLPIHLASPLASPHDSALPTTAPRIPARPHSFVKSTFSKAVECKLCHEYVKRHAVLCEECGLISHSRCAEFAPLPCDLRAQLLSYSRDVSRSGLPSRLPPPTPVAFLMDMLPSFGRSRKLKTTTSAEAPPRLSSSPPPLTPLARRRHMSELVPRRSDDAVPRVSSEGNGTSSGGSAATSEAHASLRSTQSGLDRLSSIDEPSPVSSAPPSADTPTRIKNAKLHRRKSSAAQPDFHPRKQNSEDCIVS